MNDPFTRSVLNGARVYARLAQLPNFLADKIVKLLPDATRSSISLRYISLTYFSSYVLALASMLMLMGLDANPALTDLVGNGLCLIAFVVLALALEKQRFKDFVKARPPYLLDIWPWYCWALIAVPLGMALRLAGDAVFIVVEHGAAVIEFKELMDTNYQKAGDLTAFGTLAILVAASTEEFIDRRVLFPLLARRLGIAGGALVAGTVFGALHLGYEAIFPGIVLSMIYVVSGRIWVCISVHLTSNLFYPVARVLHLRMDWAAYQAISITLLAIFLFMTVWLLVALRNRTAWPVNDAKPCG